MSPFDGAKTSYLSIERFDFFHARMTVAAAERCKPELLIYLLSIILYPAHDKISDERY